MPSAPALPEPPKEDEPDAACPPIPTVDVNELFVKHHRHLLRFVRRYVKNPDDAEDVVQTTFLEALRCAQHYSGLSKVSTWLFGIAINIARSHVRRNSADALEPLDDVVMEQLIDDKSDPCNVVELRDLVRKVDAMLARMPRGIRETLEAVLDDEVSYEEAARRLQIPIGTVRSRVSRVRSSIRDEFS